MRCIDLDPASCEYANQTVQATHYFTQAEDGLSGNWWGYVWLNPPYGRRDGQSNQKLWSQKLIREYQSGHVKQAVLLVNAVPGAKWFGPLWSYPLCFTDHRIRFYNTEGCPSQPSYSNVLVYFGPQHGVFAQVFQRFGTVVIPSTNEVERLQSEVGYGVSGIASSHVSQGCSE